MTTISWVPFLFYSTQSPRHKHTTRYSTCGQRYPLWTPILELQYSFSILCHHFPQFPLLTLICKLFYYPFVLNYNAERYIKKESLKTLGYAEKNWAHRHFHWCIFAISKKRSLGKIQHKCFLMTLYIQLQYVLNERIKQGYMLTPQQFPFQLGEVQRDGEI